MTQIITNNSGGGGGGGTSYTAGTGIEISAQNEISVEASIISGAADGATAIQPNDNISELNNDAGYIDKDVNNLTNYTKTSDLPDFTTYQLKSNMVTSLNSADDTHYPTAKAVKDAITSSGGGDVSGPSSATDGHLAVFDGATGKIIKDGGAIPTPTTVVDNLTTQSSTSALSANQGYVLDGKISTINDKIPSEASSSNKLADKDYVNDGINSVTAYYITKNAQGDQWSTYAELAAATTFYSGGVVRVPTRNDYTIVLADENHDNATTRYIYNSGWEYQYTVNETALTQAQLNALNSGITAAKVTNYDTLNTKTFYLSSTSDLTNAQAAYDWYLAGENPIVVYNKESYFIKSVNSSRAELYTVVDGKTDYSASGYSSLNNKGITFELSSDIVTTIVNPTSGYAKVLTTDVNYGTPYTPLYNGSPATKKYVDDKVSGIAFPVTSVNSQTGAVTVNEVPSGGTNGDVLTNVSGTPTWQAPAAGGIENDTTGTTSTVTKIWAGSEAEYGNITPSSTVLYFTF